VPALVGRDTRDAAETLVAVAKRVQRGPPDGLSIKDRRRPQTPDGEREYVVASLPFVESTLAKRLLAAFKTVEGVFTASEEDLQQVDKIGPKKAKRIGKWSRASMARSPDVTSSLRRILSSRSYREVMVFERFPSSSGSSLSAIFILIREIFCSTMASSSDDASSSAFTFSTSFGLAKTAFLPQPGRLSRRR
jgi:hypothetical protein